eukprot:COSAG02_NODE_43744_length_372_cov_0.728938_2_plen_26_part_01
MQVVAKRAMVCSTAVDDETSAEPAL